MTEVMMTVEIPKGSNIKYEIKDGRLICDRVLHTPMSYIFNYGCFENTLAGDEDPLDVVLITNTSFYPNCLVNCRIIGVLVTSDEKGMDEKIITVPGHNIDPQYSDINDIYELPEATLDQIKFFFENYKSLEKGKKVTVGEFGNNKEAMKIYNKSIEAYKSMKGSDMKTAMKRFYQTEK
jgi:inorganic pyrophosphatase